MKICPIYATCKERSNCPHQKPHKRMSSCHLSCNIGHSSIACCDDGKVPCKGCSGGSGSFCGDCRIKSYYTTLHSKPSNYITGLPNFVNNDI